MNKKMEKMLSQLHQRRKSKEVARLLPDTLLQAVDTDSFLYHEEIYSRHGLALFPKIEGNTEIIPQGYSVYDYCKVDNLDGLIKVIEQLKPFLKDDVLFSIGHETAFWRLVAKDLDEFFYWYSSYLQTAYLPLVMFQVDFRKGALVDSYCGYLPDEKSTNNDEVVYEFIQWER